jgi:hypothetical protein
MRSRGEAGLSFDYMLLIFKQKEGSYMGLDKNVCVD